MQPKTFLGTLNVLTAARGQKSRDIDPERARRLVLERLQRGDADEEALGDLAIPASILIGALDDLQKLEMVESHEVDGRKVFSLSPYAARALTYLAPG